MLALNRQEITSNAKKRIAQKKIDDFENDEKRIQEERQREIERIKKEKVISFIFFLFFLTKKKIF